MAAYRFCRSDDVPRLVEAYDNCFRAHDAAAPRLTVDDFQRQVRELYLWPSSCMLALSGREPIGVLLGAKTETANWIHTLAVHPEHRRQGHARHMLASLGQKLAILGPRPMWAEVAAGDAPARALLEACGFHEQAAFADFVREASAPEPRAGADALPVTVAELVETAALSAGPQRAWERRLPTLVRREASLHGLALGGGDRFAAWLLYRDDPASGYREIDGLGCADPSRTAALLGILVDACAAGAGALRIRRVTDGEVPHAILRGWGFRETGRSVGYAARAGDERIGPVNGRSGAAS
jgi:ribosomal protein S18 acetylase RimI-like enzyme